VQALDRQVVVSQEKELLRLVELLADPLDSTSRQLALPQLPMTAMMTALVSLQAYPLALELRRAFLMAIQ
jgi:hypothetical protein